ncbi:MAG: hypothetical protein EZS28_042170, partial [Streblomastix strix]
KKAEAHAKRLRDSCAISADSETLTEARAYFGWISGNLALKMNNWRLALCNFLYIREFLQLLSNVGSSSYKAFLTRMFQDVDQKMQITHRYLQKLKHKSFSEMRSLLPIDDDYINELQQVWCNTLILQVTIYQLVKISQLSQQVKNCGHFKALVNKELVETYLSSDLTLRAFTSVTIWSLSSTDNVELYCQMHQ